MFETTKWNGLSEDIVLVDPNSTCLDAVRSLVRLVDVLREYRRGETVLGVICKLDDVCALGELGNGDCWTKDFIALDVALCRRFEEDVWSDEIATKVGCLTALDDLGVLLAALNEAADTVVLCLRHDRTEEGVVVEWITDPECICVVCETLNKLIVDRLLDEDTRACATALS